MFPFKSGVLSFQVNDEGVEEQNKNFEDLDTTTNNNNHALFDELASGNSYGSNINNGRGQGRRGRGRKSVSSSLASTSNISNNTNDDYGKKITHREIERQRRQEMSDLYTSLRSILPSEYIQGKKTISDHVGEAANYIKDMEKNVKELEEKRDQLRKSQESTSNNSLSSNNVVIRQFVGVVEIEICVGYEDEEFSLSTALQIALEEGLNVISCSSTRINDKLVHSLICEVSDLPSIDVNQLHQRLINLVC